MKKIKLYLLFSFILFSGVSLQAQVIIQDLNTLLAPEGNGKHVLKPESKNDPIQLMEIFFDAHGQIATLDGQPVLWDRADKPVQNMILNSVSEIGTLKSAYQDKIFLIRTIKVDLGEDLNPVASLAGEMPNLQNILLVSDLTMPQNIDQKLADFLAGLAENQINPVSVYYYQQSQPQ